MNSNRWLGVITDPNPQVSILSGELTNNQVNSVKKKKRLIHDERSLLYPAARYTAIPEQNCRYSNKFITTV